MPRFLDTIADPGHRTLLQRKLGRLLDWQVPDIEATVGPHDTSIFERYDRRLQEAFRACRDRLDRYSDEQIAILETGKASIPDEQALLAEWRDFLRPELADLQDSQPPWFAGGFGHPDYAADFDHWSKMPRFSVRELLCLSLGIEPRHLGDADLDRLASRPIEKLHPTLRFLVRRHEQLDRVFDPMGNGWQVEAGKFLTWMDRVGFEAHTEFVRSLRTIHPAASKGGGTADPSGEPQKRADPREVDMIAALFTAMAIDNLGYEPRAKKSPIPKQIADIAAGLGLRVSDETVRKYLKRGASFIPDDWKRD